MVSWVSWYTEQSIIVLARLAAIQQSVSQSVRDHVHFDGTAIDVPPMPMSKFCTPSSLSSHYVFMALPLAFLLHSQV
jgi:hypothetical protein